MDGWKDGHENSLYPLKLRCMECIIKCSFAGCIITDVDLQVITHKFGESQASSLHTESHCHQDEWVYRWTTFINISPYAW